MVAQSHTVAVLVPCHNEAATIAQVVADFRAQLPAATIYVYDNNSSDDTAQRAAAAGAQVHREPLQGKGNVVRRMFSDIEADVFILVDGDGTYDASCAPRLVEQVSAEGVDMVNCVRVPVSATAFRPGHAFGNRVLTGLVAWIFGNRVGDILSGYRAMSRRFVKSFPALSSGFEIETELT
ncbi:MAG TPA: glycosyltransferase, partial [Steroidobacteraceae bacterium]|nr:glycosyltransferase [Steroidobacteraceae bacterium]